MILTIRASTCRATGQRIATVQTLWRRWEEMPRPWKTDELVAAVFRMAQKRIERLNLVIDSAPDSTVVGRD
jgi:hypothetical protein